MIHIQFTEEDIKTLQYERYRYPHPKVQIKMEALLLKSQGLHNDTICKIAGISPNTLRRYFKDYIDGGIEKLKEIKIHRPQSKLEQHRQTIEEYFRKNPPSTIKEAAAKIEELTGIKRSQTQVRNFLKSMGMKLLKVATVPAKADAEKQEEFKKESLEPILKEAKSGKRVVFFVDAAHFVLMPFIGFLWCFSRVFIKSPSGRKRFNVLGALNAVTHELIMITNDKYINAYSFCELLWDISLKYIDVNIPITLVLDNARYQKCKLVNYFAKLLNIELLYLPPYSPNLNVIERLWKFVKKKCLYSKYYSDFEAFKKSIYNCLSKTGTEYKEELSSLLRLNFQTFNEIPITST